VASYEFPFNERIRTSLRLEDLFSKVLLNIESDQSIHHHNAMLSFFQILDIIDRTDLKTELLQELDRQEAIMTSLIGNPQINVEVLEPILKNILIVSTKLRSIYKRIGQPLRENEWLMAIRQRAIIPGGLCEFDLPTYHYWLNSVPGERREDLKGWLDHVLPIYEAISILMNILRGSASPSHNLATQGSFQQLLGGGKPAQIMQIKVDDDIKCYPEISANKYVINIRFMSMNRSEKPRPCDFDVPFTLTLGNL
jgi:cell division protein ZapD